MKQKYIFFVFFSFLLYGPHLVKGQNDILLTQQWLSRINQNPAATGNSNNIDVYVLMRQQWKGFDNAPETQVVNIHNYFDRIRSGLGLTATHDKLGVGYDMINAKLAYAFHVNLGSKWLLSLGLSGGVIQQSYDPSKHFYIQDTDPELSQMEKKSQLNPDVDFGFELNSQKFLLGASVTHLYRLPEEQTTLKVAQQYHAYARYTQSLGSSFDLALGVRGTNFDNAIFYDISLTGILLKKYWIGAAFRPDNAVAGMVGLQLGFIRLGYSYDYSIGKINSIAQNTHEVMVSLKIGKPKKTINTKSPRFIEE